MAPIQRLKRSSASSEASADLRNEPSTWTVLTTVGSAALTTYFLYETSQKIWMWIQEKLENRRREKLLAEQTKASLEESLLTRLKKRALRKRFSPPFSAAMNVVHWTTIIVNWIYRHCDNIPFRFQNAVNRNHIKEQDKLWDLKQDEAEEKVKTILASQFPTYYKKKYLKPYEEGSELYEENLEFLNRIREIKDGAQVITAKAKW